MPGDAGAGPTEAIIEGLNAQHATTRDIIEADPGDDEGWEDRRWVPLPDAEAAVRATIEAVNAGHAEANAWWRQSREVIRAETVREIVRLLVEEADRRDEVAPTDTAQRLRWVAEWVARRFGGIIDG